MEPATQITEQLRLAARGDRDAQEEVFRKVEPEIRKIASSFLSRETKAQSMQTTMLVDDAYLRFINNPRGGEITDKMHFYRLVAKYVQNLLVDAARARNARRRGMGQLPVSINDNDAVSEDDAMVVVQVSELIDQLQVKNSLAAEVFRMHYFLHVDVSQIAKMMEITESKASGLLRYTQALLTRELCDER